MLHELNFKATTPIEIKRAYRIFVGQKDRCEKQCHKSYKYYGAKGIRVTYTAEEFVIWFLKNTNLEQKNISVGRIDHSKNYSLDNIHIQSRQENSKERFLRYGHIRPKKRVLVINLNTGDSFVVNSVQEAALKTGVSEASVSLKCSGKKPKYKKTGFNFEYA